MGKLKVMRNIFKGSGFTGSLKVAFKGIIYLFLYHRNMRFIFILGIFTFIFGLYLQLKGIELAALCITITLVFMAEMFNTAIEMMMDMVTANYNTKIKILKDIAAAIVILACLNSVAVGYILFIRKLLR